MSFPDLDKLQYRYVTLKDSKIVSAIRIQDEIISAIRDILRKNGFVEILAPIIGPVTDPGIRGAQQVSFDYYGTEFKIMSSMILYKQMAMSSLPKIFALSPNIRLEPRETTSTGRHLTEFRQIDLEAAHTTCEDMMSLGEKLLCGVVERVRKARKTELQTIGRTLRTPRKPFKRISYDEVLEILKSMGHELKFGEEVPWDLEEKLSASFEEPFWITEYPESARGFYYLRHPEKAGYLRDFDLLYPEGFGEAISGGEREYKYEHVVERMQGCGEDPAKYGWFLEMLKEGIPPSAGFGIGVERLTRFICGFQYIWDAVPFPKVAGVITP